MMPHTRATVLSAEDRFEIEALHKAWLDAELRGDSSALLQLCGAAPVWLPPNEAPLCGVAAILQWLEDQPQATVRRIDIDDLTIGGIGSFAWKLATFRTTLDSPADASVEIVSGSHAWLLQRDDAGAWLIGVVAWIIAGTEVA
jgi:ketosteroid isomerase-like protein